MLRRRISWKITFLIILLVTILVFSFTFFNPSFAEFRDQVEQNMVATYNQAPSDTVNLLAGGYSVALASPGAIPNLGFELKSAKSPVLGFETSVTSLSAAENTSQKMEILVYYENNGSLYTSGLGSTVTLITNGGQYPIQKLIAQYSTGSFEIAEQGSSYGINSTMSYNKNCREMAITGYESDNVLSPYNFTISPKFGETNSALSLYSVSQNSFLEIFFSSEVYTALNDGNKIFNVTGKEVVLSYFSEASMQLLTFTRSNFTIPYTSISSVTLNLLASSVNYMNATGGFINVTVGNGTSYGSTGEYSIQSRTPISFRVNNYITKSEVNLRYFISSSLSQVYVNGSALFLGNPQYFHNSLYRKTMALIEGALIGIFLTEFFEIVKKYLYKADLVGNESPQNNLKK